MTAAETQGAGRKAGGEGSERASWLVRSPSLVQAPRWRPSNHPCEGCAWVWRGASEMPKSSLLINPWPVGFLRELFTQGMMINGKSKHRFIISWGDGCGHVWKAESSTERSAAQWTASPGAWLQDLQANPAGVGTRPTARSFQEGSAPGQARGCPQPARSPALAPHTLTGGQHFSGMGGH